MDCRNQLIGVVFKMCWWHPDSKTAILVASAKVRTTEHTRGCNIGGNKTEPVRCGYGPQQALHHLFIFLCGVPSLSLHSSISPLALADSLFGRHGPVIHSACQSWQQNWDHTCWRSRAGRTWAQSICDIADSAGHRDDPTVKGQGFSPRLVLTATFTLLKEKFDILIFIVIDNIQA